MSDAAIDLAKSFGEQTTKSWALQNQMVLKSLETLSKNIEEFNTNSKVLKKLAKPWRYSHLRGAQRWVKKVRPKSS